MDSDDDAWLGDDSLSRSDHDAAKKTLSKLEQMHVRVVGRSKFQAIAAERGGVYKRILDRERELGGGSDERESLEL